MAPRRSRQGRRGKMSLWRKILDRLVLAFADQQLVTGISLLVSGYVKGSSDMQGLWHYIDGAHFSLIVYMSYLSSSSHLASVLTLRRYFPTTSFHLSSPSRYHWWIRAVPFYIHWYMEDLRTLLTSHPSATFPHTGQADTKQGDAIP